MLIWLGLVAVVSGKQNGTGDYAGADDSQARFCSDDDYARAHHDLGYSDW
jgi:hypothetical protein